jgi:hypothetical protein
VIPLREWLNETQAASRALGDGLVAPGTWDRLPRPDGAGTWAEDGRAVSFLLEYDLGTEHLPVLAAKLDGYALLTSVLADAGQAAPPLLFCFGSPRREQGARRALAACRDSAAVRIATAAIDPYATSPAGPVWLPLTGHQGRQVRLIDLDAALPDPWQDYRQQRARQRREAAEREQALLRADEDDEEPATYGTAEEEAFGQWP